MSVLFGQGCSERPAALKLGGVRYVQGYGMRYLAGVIVGLTAGLASAQGASDRAAIRPHVQIEVLSHTAPYRFADVDTPTRRGDQAQRFEIRHGDCGASVDWNDCQTDRGRVEMKERPKNVMSKPGQGIWYGYSMLIPDGFVSLGRGNTVLGQVKAEGWGAPMWSLTFNDNSYLNFPDQQKCRLGPLSDWVGQWVDMTIYAHYGFEGQERYFALYKDGRLLCQRDTPFVPGVFRGKPLKLGLKYGIYSSYVSRYLAQNGTMPEAVKEYRQSAAGQAARSPSPTPFIYDWGVRLPTHVVFYDEMRFGATRQDVDVRLLEQRGVPPVD